MKDKTDAELEQMSCALRIMALMRAPGASKALHDVKSEIDARRPRDRWSSLVKRVGSSARETSHG